MNCNARYIRWFLGIVVVLLCFVLCRVDSAMVVDASSQVTETAIAEDEPSKGMYASLCEKEDDMLHALREMGQWGIPSTSVTLQGATGRVLTVCKALQRITRLVNMLQANESSNGYGVAAALHHTLSSKRFHSGYYIYYRCQMRC